jgi:feruloyl esterase
MRRYDGLVVASLIAGMWLSTAAASAPLACDPAQLQRKAPAGVKIADATVVAAADRVPAHCLVNGSVATPGNQVMFRLGLPQVWNGKFFFQGVGGFAGSLGRLDAGLERGYAAATTDTGHQGSGTDGSWALNDRAKEIDYGHRGTHVAAVAGKQLTAAFFGKPASRAYFSGCSNGGRQALMEAQRYPQDFDGIVAGDPSFGALGYVRRAMNYQVMLAGPERVLPPEKLEVVSKAVLAACDERDGLVDGLIGDPRQCSFDPKPLLCQAGDAADCLTQGQLATLQYLYSDVGTPPAQMRGFPVGHEAGSTGWPLWVVGRSAPTRRADGAMDFGENSPTGYRFARGFFSYMAFEQDDPSYDWRKFDPARDLQKIQTIAQILSPTSTDLSKFVQRGGKLLMYHGWADPAISAYGSIDYYNKVVAANGGKAASDEFVRLFLAPGMHHCRGGPGPDDFDTLTALEQWVEQGRAPAQMLASHAIDGKVDRTRLLCPEPQVAHYVGKGSSDSAESFRCEAAAKP